MRKEKHFLSRSPSHGAKHYGLDTGVKVHFPGAVHNTTMAVNAIRAVAKNDLVRNVEVMIA